jgi:hypothetical protein
VILHLKEAGLQLHYPDLGGEGTNRCFPITVKRNLRFSEPPYTRPVRRWCESFIPLVITGGMGYSISNIYFLSKLEYFPVTNSSSSTFWSKLRSYCVIGRSLVLLEIKLAKQKQSA